MSEKKYEVFSVSNLPPVVPCSSGRDLVPTYREVIPVGKPSYLEKVGETSMQDMIDSFSQSSSLADKIARYEAGDTSALFSNGGFYADLTGAPTSLAEAVKVDTNLATSFDSLPSEIKALFGDLNGFKQSVLDHSYDRVVNSFLAKQSLKPESDKKGETSSEA